MSIYDPQGEPGPAYTPQQTSTTALISLIAGIMGLTFFPFIGSIIAVITGPMAKREIQENPSLSGEGLATAGVILGWIGIALGVISLCVIGALIAFPFCAVLFAAVEEGINWLAPALFSIVP